MQRKEPKPRGSDHRPTRQHIAYLGGILQDDVKHVERRAAFWAKATAKLDALSKRVSSEERQKDAELVALQHDYHEIAVELHRDRYDRALGATIVQRATDPDMVLH